LIRHNVERPLTGRVAIASLQPLVNLARLDSSDEGTLMMSMQCYHETVTREIFGPGNRTGTPSRPAGAVGGSVYACA